MEDILPVNRYHSQQKQRNLTELVHLFQQQPEVRNHDAQDLLNVSPKTARNYFDTLERDGVITQHGTSGRDVYYTLNR